MNKNKRKKKNKKEVKENKEINKNSRNLLWTIFLYLSWLFVFVSAIIQLFNGVYYNVIHWTFFIIVLIFIYFYFVKIPQYIHLLLSLMLILNLFGEFIFEFYYHFIYYDKFLHIIYPFFLCIFVYSLFKDKIENKRILILFCMFFVISLGVFWEIFEYFIDLTFDSLMQGVNLVVESGTPLFWFEHLDQVIDPLTDTMTDLITNIIGTILFAISYYFYINRRKLKP